MLALNNATYQSVSITAWISANPDLLLFGVPESVFAKFPKHALIMMQRGLVRSGGAKLVPYPQGT